MDPAAKTLLEPQSEPLVGPFLIQLSQGSAGDVVPEFIIVARRPPVLMGHAVEDDRSASGHHIRHGLDHGRTLREKDFPLGIGVLEYRDQRKRNGTPSRARIPAIFLSEEGSDCGLTSSIRTNPLRLGACGCPRMR